MNSHNIVMWEIQYNNSDQDRFRILILSEIWRIQNLHQVEHCEFLEVIHLVQSVGRVRNKPLSHSSNRMRNYSLDAGLRMDGTRG